MNPGVARPIHIGLAWHSHNSGNLGIGALTLGHMTLIREVADELGLVPRFTLFTGRQAEPPYIHGFDQQVDLTNLAMLLPHRSLRAVAAQDCLLDIGEGDGFSDIYGLKRLVRQVGLKWQAWLSRVPFVLAPQTIGPFTTKRGRKLARWTLRHAAQACVRDAASAKTVSQLVPGLEPLLATDLSFAMKVAPASLPQTGKTRIGINVSGLLFNKPRDEDRISTDIDHAGFIDALLERLAIRGDLEIHLFGHVRGSDPVDNDTPAAAHFAARHPGTILVPPFHGSIEAKSWIAAMDLVIAARMHACIAALSTGVPVVPLSYSPKFEGLFSSLDWPWLVPHRGMDQATGLALIDDALTRLPELRSNAAKARDEGIRRLEPYRAFLRRFLAGLKP